MAGAISSRDRRLRQGWQFREVYRSGKSIRGRLMSLVTLTREDDHGRVAYVASRKVGDAVRRNRAKRLLREAFRAQPLSKRDAPRWRIWIATAACSRSTLSEVSIEMDRLLSSESK